MKEWEEGPYTGAMYSSVPTKEFDCIVGSATNVGSGWDLDLLLFEGNEFFKTWHMIRITVSTKGWERKPQINIETFYQSSFMTGREASWPIIF